VALETIKNAAFFPLGVGGTRKIKFSAWFSSVDFLIGKVTIKNVVV